MWIKYFLITAILTLVAIFSYNKGYNDRGDALERTKPIFQPAPKTDIPYEIFEKIPPEQYKL